MKATGTLEVRGIYVVATILALTGIVGALFIYLGPRATATAPGIVHVGLRYDDEGTVDFLRFGKKGPPARLQLFDASGATLLEAAELGLGRNLVAIGNLPSGECTARLEAFGYGSVELPVRIEGRMLRPVPGKPLPPGSHVDDNMIGVRLERQKGVSPMFHEF